ncbi:DUF6221 family protein [Nonomuraea sp. NPDC050394]|uniref:DUF6221 family protein n=1 Tax=Nonomuraea sp. NPDC050394 TaxID=3364363 RepID=UPI0037B56E88
MSRPYDELSSRDPGTATPSFDVQQARDMVAWLRATITGTRVLAERAEGGAVVWHIQASDHQFVDLAFRLPGGTVMPVTYGGDEGAMMRRDAEHTVRHNPLHEYQIAKYHLSLLDQHAIREDKIHRYDDDGGRHLVPFATCTYCDTGNPYEAPHMGYPCPTIRGLLAAHHALPGFNPEWTEQ